MTAGSSVALGSAAIAARASPAARPLRLRPRAELTAMFDAALSAADGRIAAHCIHELWMRAELQFTIEAWLERLWRHAAPSIPEWLPMRYIEWLPLAYEVAARFQAPGGRSNIYLVLLDYSERRDGPHGVYVGMSHYAPAQRFERADDGGEQVVEIVCNASGKLADGFHLLGLAQPLLAGA